MSRRAETGFLWAGFIWFGLVVLVNIAGIIGAIVTAPSLWVAWQKITDWYSPFNLWTWGLTILLALPGVGLLKLAEVYKQRREAATKVQGPTAAP